MKNHRIIKLGLIISDKSDIRDYQIKIIHSLKKNKHFNVKLFYIDNHKQNIDGLKKIFFLEKKFHKKNYSSIKLISKYRKIVNISYKELESYKKNDVDIFINLSAKNISNIIVGNNKIFWEIVYGNQNTHTYPVCFDNILNNDPFTKIKIIELHKNKFRIIDEGFFNIKNYALLNQEFVFEKTISILLKSLKLLSEKSINYKKTNKYYVKNKEIKLFEIFKYFFKNYLIYNFNSKKDNWQIFFSKKKKLYNLQNLSQNFIENKSNSYFADPFIYNLRKKTYIFFENFSKKLNRGHISFIDLENRKNIINIIKKPYHLSYPFILDYKNKIYLIPESSKKNQLQIWKCKTFPHKWFFFKKKLIGENFTDPTFFLDKKNNLWLFINKSIDKFKDHDSELYIYKVEDDFKKFVPHKLNPVVIDCRFARNAGNLFYYKKKLIKPCQINIFGKYGYGLQLLEITKLNLNEFNFKKINSFKNIHHLSVTDQYMTWDYNLK